MAYHKQIEDGNEVADSTRYLPTTVSDTESK